MINISDLSLNTLLIIYCVSASILAIFGYNCYYYIFLFLKNKKRVISDNNIFLEGFYKKYGRKSLPVVTTQLPIFNEKYVADRLIDAVVKMDYPKGKHEIQVLDDSTDDTVDVVKKTVAKYKKLGFKISRIHRKIRTDFKAGALQHGMNKCKGKFIAIFDSDFVPPKDFLIKTVPFLVSNNDLCLVQTRWGHLNPNSSLLTRAQSIGIDGHFVIEQSARNWGGLFLNFNGTAGIWRKESIYNAGGWHGDTLTEDMDLSYRAQLAGWKTKFLYEVTCKAELPENINAYKSQQYRWAKGSIQTAIKLLPSILKSTFSFKKKLQSVLHITHYSIHPFMILMALASLPVIAFIEFDLPVFAYTILAILIAGSLLAPTSLYIVSQAGTYINWKRRLLILPYLICIGVGVAVNNTQAVLSAIFGSKGSFIRTPKSGSNSTFKRKKLKRSYRVKINYTFLIEIFLSIYCFFSFLVYIMHAKYIIGPFLLIYFIGFSISAFLSIKHHIAYS